MRNAGAKVILILRWAAGSVWFCRNFAHSCIAHTQRQGDPALAASGSVERLLWMERARCNSEANGQCGRKNHAPMAEYVAYSSIFVME